VEVGRGLVAFDLEQAKKIVESAPAISNSCSAIWPLGNDPPRRHDAQGWVAVEL
jgi:hypothetical protein